MNRIIRGGIVGTLAIPLGLSLVQMANAQAPFPKYARQHIVYMARAMDQCVAPTLTVSAPANLPANGCAQTNVVTDDQLNMGFARVYLHESGRIIVVGGGFGPNPANAKLQMTLRITRTGVGTVGMGVQTVTFPDFTVQCPTLFTSQPDGSIYGKTTLASCLGPANAQLAAKTSNVEVVSSSLLNAGNGDEVFGRPGLLR